MKLPDLTEVSLRNLWRIKLRATLTIAGVVIAIATFVAMLSFAAGNHRYFTTAFNEFGFLNQMSVRPLDRNAADTTDVSVLDNEAIQAISAIPGVRLAYPFSSFDVSVAVLDTVVTTTARSLPPEVVRTKLFSRILGGREFSQEAADEAIVTQEFVDLVGAEPDSLLGRTLEISMRVASLDSALMAVVGDPVLEANELFRTIRRDSIFHQDYQRRFMRKELGQRFQRFFDGLMNRQATVSDTLTIVGVAPEDTRYRVQTAPIVIPERTARRLSSGGFVIDENPADLLVAVRDGRLFDKAGGYDKRSYPRVTLELEPLANHTTIKDSIETMGYRAFSFAEQFDEIQRFMVYYYLGLGVIGLIALVTASLGIINTLVMSITERRREIGILKSLGADESDIRRLFLVESGVIGAIGAALGITIGWLGTRIVAAIARTIMEREDMPVFDPFALPLWLIALALAFGILVSLLAGLYPAARAARVDPVEALRSE
jgi:putative ABC transport system permease protein